MGSSPEGSFDYDREHWLGLLVLETINCFLVLCSQVSYLTSPGLSFLQSKLGAVIIGNDLNFMLLFCGSHKRIQVEHQIHSKCSNDVSCYCYYNDCCFLLSPQNYTVGVYFYHFKSGESLVARKPLAGLCGW